MTTGKRDPEPYSEPHTTLTPLRSCRWDIREDIQRYSGLLLVSRAISQSPPNIWHAPTYFSGWGANAHQKTLLWHLTDINIDLPRLRSLSPLHETVHVRTSLIFAQSFWHRYRKIAFHCKQVAKLIPILGGILSIFDHFFFVSASVAGTNHDKVFATICPNKSDRRER